MVSSKRGSSAHRDSSVSVHSGKSSSICAATLCSGWLNKHLTAQVSTSHTPRALRVRFRNSTFGGNQRCVYKCPSNSQRHGGPPPPLGVQGANTGFSLSGYIRHEMYSAAAIALPTVPNDHHVAHKPSMSGSRTPYVVSAPIQRYGRAFIP